MKIVSSLIILITLVGSCKTSNQPLEESNPLKKTVQSGSQRPASKQDIVGNSYKLSISYEALSRGSFEYVSISKDEILTTSDRSFKNMNRFTCKPDDWEELSALISSVDIDTFQQLKAPTDKRLYDGAPHATLSIIKGDMEIRTPSFDHGHPPIKIEALVTKVLSIKESVSKH